MRARTPVWLLCQLLPTQSCFSSWEVLVEYRRALFILWLTNSIWINRIQVFSRQFHHICIRFSIGHWTLIKGNCDLKKSTGSEIWPDIVDLVKQKNSWKQGSQKWLLTLKSLTLVQSCLSVVQQWYSSVAPPLLCDFVSLVPVFWDTTKILKNLAGNLSRLKVVKSQQWTQRTSAENQWPSYTNQRFSEKQKIESRLLYAWKSR